MRQLTAALEAAQKQTARTPCVKVRAVNKTGGVLRQKWQRLYTGTETDGYHGAAVAGDGSLIRVRVTPVSDSRKIYVQRVAAPCPSSDFSQWTYTGQYDALVVAAAACGAEVSVFWVKANKEIKRIKSGDNGVTWGSTETLDTLPSVSVFGIAAAYKTNGDLAVFIAEQAVLHAKKCLGGQWQAKTSWDKTTGNLSGAACVYDGDWNLLVTGKDAAGNYKAWSLAYGDGGSLSSGSWSALRELASAPAAGDFAYKQPFLDKPDTCCCFFVETFSGNQAYSRPFRSYIVPGTDYIQGLWHEAVPFDLSSDFGLAMAHHGACGWLSSPGGVWMSPAAEQVIDLSGDIVKVRQELGGTGGELVVELNNDNGKYAFPGTGGLEMLDTGCRLEFSPGCFTPQGEEFSEGQHYTIQSIGHISGGGRAGLVIQAADGWKALENWRAVCQMRWNKNTDDLSVKDIMAVILGRAGLKLSVITQSAAVTGFFPDFTINPGNNGRNIIEKLLAFVPDRLFFEGDTGFLVDPQSGDNVSYSYGNGHAVMEARYRVKQMDIGRVQVEGWDPSAGEMILTDTFSPHGADYFTRPVHIKDRNLDTVTLAGQRGAAVLRKAEIGSEESVITVPVNCGQQLYDVVAVTDLTAGLDAQSKRVIGIALVYDSLKGEYFQRLKMGRV